MMEGIQEAIAFGCMSISIAISVAAFSITMQLVKLREDLAKRDQR